MVLHTSKSQNDLIKKIEMKVCINSSATIANLECRFKFFVWIPLFIFLGFSNQAYSKTCVNTWINQMDSPFDFVVSKSDIIFTGEVATIERSTIEGNKFNLVTLTEKSNFENINVLKGYHKDYLTVVYERRDCTCQFNFKLNEEYLIFANETKNGQYEILFCDYVKKVEEAKEMIRNLTKKSTLSSRP